ncbi:MAG: hypothetical protein LLG04_03015 [Parachlamydia sp.]|nr:hypothetical protein [Parachlamydia sp.]
MSTSDSEELKLSAQEKRMATEFLSECIGNKKLNGVFKDLLKSQLPEGISTQVLVDLRSFSYKTRGYEQFPKLNAKLQALNKSLEEGTNLPDTDKFSLMEWGRLNHFEDAVAYLEPFYDKQLLEVDDSKAAKFYQDAESLDLDREEIESRFQKEVSQSNHYQSGDILTYIGSKWAQFKGGNLDREEWLTSHFISKYGHAGKLHRTTSEVKTSEIFASYRNVTFDVHEAALSHVWRLDIVKLIKKSSSAYWAYSDLLRRNGQDPDEVIVKLYQEIERELHEKGEANFSEIDNVKERRWDAGLADFGLKGGHRRKKERADRFEKVHQKMIKKPPKEPSEMICSEFATKATIASLIELDRRLTERLESSMQGLQASLNIFGDELKGEPRKRAEMATRILDILDHNKKDKRLNFINLPINNKERLKRIHPERMVGLLKKKNCIKRIDPPPVVKAVFKKSVFK